MGKFKLISAILLLAVLLLLIGQASSIIGDPDWKSVFIAVISNIITALITGLAIYYIIRDKEALGSKENEVNSIKIRLTEETDEIDIQLKAIEKKIDLNTSQIEKFNNKKSISSWEDYSNVLKSLRGNWLEFIPSRLENSCEISIASFHLDNDDKHEFSGTNFLTNSGNPNYQWRTEKVLPPIRHDSDTIFIYYIYKRSNNNSYNDKYGFGKLIAKREEAGNDKYSFTGGFFFNEATPENGHYEMKLISLEAIEGFLGEKMEFRDNNSDYLKSIFKLLKDSKIYEEWRRKM